MDSNVMENEVVADDVVFTHTAIERADKPLTAREKLMETLRRVKPGDQSAIGELDAGVYGNVKFASGVKPDKGWVMRKLSGLKAKDLTCLDACIACATDILENGQASVVTAKENGNRISMGAAKDMTLPTEAREQVAASLFRESGYTEADLTR